MLRRQLALYLLMGLFLAGQSGIAIPGERDEPTADQLDFFEKKIRPVLSQQCYTCHAADAKNIRGGLVVDSQAGLLQGGDSGPAIVPGKPDESLLVEALKHESLEMPPTEKLPEGVINDFVKWIEMGAPDPRKGSTAVAIRHSIDLAAGRQFWSFREPVRAIPPTPRETWSWNEIDRFILTRLEAASLAPAADADRLVLLRRLSLDLTGLPPSPEEIEFFEADHSPGAVERVVDRLLNSPHFGERWGRHWLDLARYSDSTGGGRSMLYQTAWRYRDYVIESFNKDKPFNDFIVEQIAGDLLPFEDYRQGQEQMIATAFLALGPTNFEEQDKEQLRMDVIDEQIDTIGRAFLAMTLGCARCHDHKFDPIPTADYYALAGIFRSTQTMVHENVSSWISRRMPVSVEETEKVREHEQRVKPLEAEIAQIRDELEKLGTPPKGTVVDDEAASFSGIWTASQSVKKYVGSGYRYTTRAGDTAVFSTQLPPGEYSVFVSYTAAANRGSKVAVKVENNKRGELVLIDQQQKPTEDDIYTPIGDFHFDGPAVVTIRALNDGESTIADAVRFVPINAEQSEKQSRLRHLRAKLIPLKKELEEIQKLAPVVPETLSVNEEEKTGNYHICIRGNVRNLGEVVPRGFLSVAASDDAEEIPQSHSGRLELARWIASSENPLTSRVIVNRIWSHLFGEGIVRTVDNFGAPGERPSHPELLDWLAIQFVEDGWSIKRMVRRIVLSRTYQLASRDENNPDIDPENRLWARQNRRRLDAETLQDVWLSVSGELSPESGGDAVRPGTKSEYDYEFPVGRRAVYLPVFRNELPDLYTVFDFPDPNLSRGQRTASTLPTQALFLLNNPFVLDRAIATAKRVQEVRPNDDERLEWLTLSYLGRHPTAEERDLVDRFLHQTASGAALKTRWERICQALMGSVSLRYVD